MVGAGRRRGVEVMIASVTCRGDREVVPTGAALALALAFAVFVGTMIGGLGIEEGLARSARAGLLVLVATGLRCRGRLGAARGVATRASGASGRCLRRARRS